ncbi:hypothetical protein J6590_012503, partial [Homalodisca vitripennis]
LTSVTTSAPETKTFPVIGSEASANKDQTGRVCSRVEGAQLCRYLLSISYSITLFTGATPRLSALFSLYSVVSAVLSDNRKVYTYTPMGNYRINWTRGHQEVAIVTAETRWRLLRSTRMCHDRVKPLRTWVVTSDG